MNFFMEVAKLRAARLLWAKLVQPVRAERADESLSLRTHCQTSGWSLTAQDVFNNVVRTCVEAMAATQGHTQSLHTNALDEALALPTDFSARIARNTQLLLQQESGTCRVIDPWGGSYYVERLTHDLAARAWAHIDEVEEAGGMTEAIEAGLPKLRIEEAAARTQARIDSGRQPVVGVNLFRPDAADDIEVLKVDNSAVRAEQIAKLRAAARRARPGRVRRRAGRADRRRAGARRRRPRGDEPDAQPARAGDRRGPGAGDGRRDQRRAGGRCSAGTRRRSVRSAVCTAPRSARRPSVGRGARRWSSGSPRREGRRPRILVAKMGQDGHDRGQKVIATAFADLGFDVDVGPLFQTPERGRAPGRRDRRARRRRVDARRRSPHARARAARARSPRSVATTSLVVVGGVIPPQDFDALRAAGAAAIFPPGTVIADAAAELLDSCARWDRRATTAPGR